MTCPAHRTHLHVIRTPREDRAEEPRPVTDTDAATLVVKALTEASGVTQWVEGRPQPLVMETDGLRVTVWDDAEPDDAPGIDYAVTLTRLARCPIHNTTYRAADRLCDVCVVEQTQGDE
jgi:hypothetical protein